MIKSEKETLNRDIESEIRLNLYFLLCMFFLYYPISLPYYVCIQSYGWKLFTVRQLHCIFLKLFFQ